MEALNKNRLWAGLSCKECPTQECMEYLHRRKAMVITYINKDNILTVGKV